MDRLIKVIDTVASKYGVDFPIPETSRDIKLADITTSGCSDKFYRNDIITVGDFMDCPDLKRLKGVGERSIAEMKFTIMCLIYKDNPDWFLTELVKMNTEGAA